MRTLRVTLAAGQDTSMHVSGFLANVFVDQSSSGTVSIYQQFNTTRRALLTVTVATPTNYPMREQIKDGLGALIAGAYDYPAVSGELHFHSTVACTIYLTILDDAVGAR